ncbi:MAG: alpha/beta hydrolase, partial [Methyloceanibacter sp.]
SATMPRSAGDIVADLRALLVAAGVRPPYVLVGHSFGGLVVRLFASTVPDEVVGLVLVDAAQEEFWTRLKALVTPEQWKGMITGTPPELADYRDFEKLDVDASAAEMRRAAAARPLRPLPLIVLSRGLPMELSPDMSAKLPANFSAEQERIWQNCQDELVALVPGAQHVVATNNETIADALGQSSPGMAMHYAKEADLRKKMTGVVRRFDRRMNKAATKAVKPTD